MPDAARIDNRLTRTSKGNESCKSYTDRVDWSLSGTLEELMAGGSLLPAQQPQWCFWSPEKRLAGAVLATALIEVRDHHSDPKYRRLVAEDLVWIRSNDARDPYSFLRLCQLLNIEPVWVRETVHRWMAETAQAAPPPRPTVTSLAAAPRRRRPARGPHTVLRTTDQARVALAD